MSDVLVGAWVGLLEVRCEEFGEHPAAEVLFDDDVVDLVLLGDVSQLLKSGRFISSPYASCVRDEEVAMEHLDHGVSCLVLALSRRVDGEDGACVFRPMVFVEPHGTEVSVSVEAYAGQLLDDEFG